MFELKDNQVIISPQSLSLPFFKVIWDTDKSKGKESAYKELSYIFYLYDNKSPYYSYPLDRRRELILKDIIKDSKWKPSKLVEEGLIKYKELTTTQSTELLESVRGLLYKLQGYFDSLSFDPKGDVELEMKKADAVLKATSGVSKAIESLDALEQRVKKETRSKESITGDKTLGIYSE